MFPLRCNNCSQVSGVRDTFNATHIQVTFPQKSLKVNFDSFHALMIYSDEQRLMIWYFPLSSCSCGSVKHNFLQISFPIVRVRPESPKARLIRSSKDQTIENFSKQLWKGPIKTSQSSFNHSEFFSLCILFCNFCNEMNPKRRKIRSFYKK